MTRLEFIEQNYHIYPDRGRVATGLDLSWRYRQLKRCHYGQIGTIYVLKSCIVMKRIAIISAWVLLMMGIVGGQNQLQAQTADALFGKVTALIKSGNAEGLSQHFNSSVEVTVPGSDGVRASKQAQFLMKDFFAKHKPKKFQIVHKGNSGSTHYATGTYVAEGMTFDTNIFVKKVGDKFVITQIRFEEE